jgi:hypothetical protein
MTMGWDTVFPYRCVVTNATQFNACANRSATPQAAHPLPLAASRTKAARDSDNHPLFGFSCPFAPFPYTIRGWDR